jgi:hypothetical protein
MQTEKHKLELSRNTFSLFWSSFSIKVSKKDWDLLLANKSLFIFVYMEEDYSMLSLRESLATIQEIGPLTNGKWINHAEYIVAK